MTTSDEQAPHTTNADAARRSHKLRVLPVKIIVYDDLLRAHAVKGIGFRGECSCQWKGPRRKLHSLAAADARWHSEGADI